MIDNDIKYGLVGEVSVPEERRAELGNHVVKLLGRYGAYRVKEMELAGEKFKVLTQPEEESDGCVYWDYTLLNGRMKNVASYNLNTCEFKYDGRGSNPLIVLINTLLESYSSTPCYIFNDGDIVPIDNMIGILKDMLDTEFSFPHRIYFMDYLLFERAHGELKKVLQNIFTRVVPEPMDYLISENLRSFVYSLYLEKDMKEDETKLEKDKIADMKDTQKRQCVYNILSGLKKQNKDVAAFIKKLIAAPCSERMEMAKEDSGFGDLAALSVYEGAEAILAIYARVYSLNFWDEWDEFTADGYYSDNINNYNDLHDDYPKLPLYRAIREENEDETFGIRSDRKQVLSDEMTKAVEQWKEIFKGTELPEDYDAEKELVRVMRIIRDEWRKEYFDRKMIDEILSHKDDPAYKKAVFLLGTVAERYMDLFPELARVYVADWAAKMCRDSNLYTEFATLQRVIGNKEVFDKIFMV